MGHRMPPHRDDTEAALRRERIACTVDEQERADRHHSSPLAEVVQLSDELGLYDDQPPPAA